MKAGWIERLLAYAALLVTAWAVVIALGAGALWLLERFLTAIGV